jgi:hypothetical protein
MLLRTLLAALIVAALSSGTWARAQAGAPLPSAAPPLRSWAALVEAASARHDGPSLEMVDIPSLGYGGEGWSDYLPAQAHQRALIDIEA